MIASRNRLAELRPLVPEVVETLAGDLRKSVYHIPG